MDFTHPAGRLHLSQAPLHSLVLEYYQGMWHLIRNAHTHTHTSQSNTCTYLVFFWTKTIQNSCLFSACVYVNNNTALCTAVVSYVEKWDKWWSSQIKTKVQLMFQQKDFIYHLVWLAVLPVLATCCYLSNYSFFFFFADSAHLLLTLLPHCFGQLFFQQQPRIKSWWVLVFLASINVSSSWHESMLVERKNEREREREIGN